MRVFLASLYARRLCRRLLELEETVREKLAWLVSLPEYVWSEVSSVVGCSSAQLRSDSLIAANVSAAFIEFRVFREAHKLPWSLAIGDVDSNLTELASGQSLPR